jgi:deoxyribonuclease V
MQVRSLHSWDLSPTEAIALQRAMAGQIDTAAPLERCELIAGADVSYGRFSNIFYAGVVVVRVADGEVVEKQGAVVESSFPYIPGLLSFREAPALLEAFAEVQSDPDAVMLDAHGFSHPRRFGITCHVGLLLDRPTIGCAKSRLTGTFREPARKAGATSPLCDGSDVIGAVVRTKPGVKPIFVSVGHRIDLASAVRITLAAGRGYRLPEPTRLAHHYVNDLRRRHAT